MRLLKKDSHNGQVLLHMMFDLKNEVVSGEQFSKAVSQLKDEESHLLQNQFTTDEQGSTFISVSFPGKYQLNESQAPDGYLLDDVPVTFEIQSGNDRKIDVIKFTFFEILSHFIIKSQ
ncbi:MSCRAMM family protein [Isobaculum melis]|uniref:Cna protein B-type domain-containing protein n=1 Tax=Isobaculum melis TaxID=142588 RepID=A0A1H9UCV2_9LACT|nr:SpaA isopeptide-forming pilin-related protein [Isobaculum melis]SES07162.1 Cna protein B-type domain-containing protein [Isobaculum melis]